MAEFYITTAIIGSATASVEAATEEEARAKFEAGEVEFEIDDWDINTREHMGGFLDITEG